MAESIQNINMMYIQLATIERLDRQRSRLVYVPNLPKLPFSGRLGLVSTATAESARDG